MRQPDMLALTRHVRVGVLLALGLQASPARGLAQGDIRLSETLRLTNQEVRLRLTAPSGWSYRLDGSTNLADWRALVTLAPVAGGVLHTDSAAPFYLSRFYRAFQWPDTNVLTGDHLATDDGDVVIHPINHASFVMGWKETAIYPDPVGGAAPYRGLPRANLILITHAHTDHFDASTITAVKSTNAIILAPTAVYQSLSTTLRSQTVVLTNGATTEAFGISIQAIPAYNLTSSYHPKGTGNGYVLTIGGRRIFVSGDTEDIPEMRALRDIDVAFVCMNLPYTMTIARAVSAVQEFRPRVVYPYHYSGSDVGSFKRQVGTATGIEVRLRKWY